MSNDGYPHGKPSLVYRIRSSALLQRLLRIFQFLSPLVSIILFSYRIYKVLTLVHHLSRASGAVEGILAAALAYTLILMIMRLTAHNRVSGWKWLTWLLIVLDLCFMAAFIAVAALTSPQHHGDSAACSRKNAGILNSRITGATHGNTACNLPWGTFGLAIFSTILHFTSAVFPQAKHRDSNGYDDREKHANNNNRGGINNGYIHN